MGREEGEEGGRGREVRLEAGVGIGRGLAAVRSQTSPRGRRVVPIAWLLELPLVLRSNNKTSGMLRFGLV